MTLQDVYGNRYTYAHLGSVSQQYPVPKQDAIDPDRAARAVKANGDESDPKPSAPASAGRQVDQSDAEPAQPQDAGAANAQASVPIRSACSRKVHGGARQPAASTVPTPCA